MKLALMARHTSVSGVDEILNLTAMKKITKHPIIITSFRYPFPSWRKENIPASPIDRLPECFVIFLIAARSRSRINNLESKSKWPSMAPLEHHEIVNVCSLDNRRPISGNSCNGV